MGSKKYLAILQARLSSTRLPGKVLLPILGRPMLELQVERILRSTKISELLIATSTSPEDEKIVALCLRLGIRYYQGQLDDVLDRFYKAAEETGPENVIRLTGDCPLVDPSVIDRVVTYFESDTFDYASNTLEPTFPDGLDVEVFTFSGLRRCWSEARLPSEREHVTPYFYSNPQIFKLGSYKDQINRSNIRWTVDEAADYELITKIYEGCYRNNAKFDMNDVLTFLESNPELMEINANFQRNEGYLKSLEKDKKFRN